MKLKNVTAFGSPPPAAKGLLVLSEGDRVRNAEFLDLVVDGACRFVNCVLDACPTLPLPPEAGREYPVIADSVLRRCDIVSVERSFCLVEGNAAQDNPPKHGSPHVVVSPVGMSDQVARNNGADYCPEGAVADCPIHGPHRKGPTDR